MNKKIFSTEEYEIFLEQIGINNLKGRTYKQKIGKKEQIADFLTQILAAVKKLSGKRELFFVDCACGKSYVSFAANYLLTKKYGLKIKFICIDNNSDIICTCRETAQKLGFFNMNFICEDISRVRMDIKPDIVYSLHACDRATDMAIAFGIKSRAQNILTVSCCQHSVENSMRGHPLTQLTRHSAYKERLSDMLADSMRALILESRAYKANLFEFTPAESTPKNIMLRAVKTGSVSEEKASLCARLYNELKDMFNSEPKLNHYLEME